MGLPRFEYRLAGTIAEATSWWSEQPGAYYLAGGTDLLPQARLGRRTPRVLIDIKRIPDLLKLREGKEGEFRIGAAVPLSDIAAHPAVKKHFPLLASCCLAVGAFPLRHRATMAGNVCNASPAADTAVALILLEAAFATAGPKGARTIQAANFFLGPGKSALRDGELLVETILPPASRGWKGKYLRLARRQGMDLATVGVLVAGAGGKRGWRHRIALAAVAPTPLRVREAEELLDSVGLSASAKAAAIGREACSPITDIRGSAEYRREMVEVLIRRGLQALA